MLQVLKHLQPFLKNLLSNLQTILICDTSNLFRIEPFVMFIPFTTSLTLFAFLGAHNILKLFL